MRQNPLHSPAFHGQVYAVEFQPLVSQSRWSNGNSEPQRKVCIWLAQRSIFGVKVRLVEVQGSSRDTYKMSCEALGPHAKHFDSTLCRVCVSHKHLTAKLSIFYFGGSTCCPSVGLNPLMFHLYQLIICLCCPRFESCRKFEINDLSFPRCSHAQRWTGASNNCFTNAGVGLTRASVGCWLS